MLQAPFLSPFSHVLQTNYVPTAGQLSAIRSVIQEPESRLRALEEQLKQLQDERDKLHRYIHLHRMLLSPFRRIPADIWGEIFVHALPDETPCRTLKEVPLLLVSICHSWREIAFKTPRLWNSIDISLPSFYGKLSPKKLEYLIKQRKSGVKAWLDRSGSLPITFSITLSAPYGDLNVSRIFADFIDLVAHFSRRLKMIRLFSNPVGATCDDSVWARLAGLNQEDFPILKEVEISTGLFVYGHDDNDNLDSSQAALVSLLPQITTIRSIHFEEQPVTSLLGLEIRWDALTHLNITSYSDPTPNVPAVVQTLARSCSSLISLKLDVFLDHTNGLPSSTVSSSITASFQRFEFKAYYDPSWWSEKTAHLLLKSTFGSIVAPDLEELTVGTSQVLGLEPLSEEEEYVPSTTSFHDLIALSNAPITHLSIGESTVAHREALSRTVQLVPSLTSLCLGQQRGLTEQRMKTVAGLHLLMDDTSLCPNLRKVEVHSNPADVEVMVLLLDSRPTIDDLTVHFGIVQSDTEAEEAVSSTRVADWLKDVRASGKRVGWKWRASKVDYGMFDGPRVQPPSNIHFVQCQL